MDLIKIKTKSNLDEQKTTKRNRGGIIRYCYRSNAVLFTNNLKLNAL